MERTSHGGYVEGLRRQAATIACAALAGQLDVLEACLQLLPSLAGAELPPGDSRVMLLSAVCSELDALPIGAVRSQWAPEALQQLEPQIQAARAWATPQVVPIFTSVAQDFGV